MPKISSDFIEHRHKRDPFETYPSSASYKRFQLTCDWQTALGGKALVDPAGKFENTVADAVFPAYVKMEPVFDPARENWVVTYYLKDSRRTWSEVVPTKLPAIWRCVVTNYLADITELGSETVGAVRQSRNMFVHGAEFIDPGQAHLYLPEPEPTVEHRFSWFASKLELLSTQGASFDRPGEALKTLCSDHPEAVSLLVDMVQDEKRHPRLRWFAIEILTQLDHADLTKITIDALRAWPETMALLGATIALRFRKLSEHLRSDVRTQLLRRLREKCEKQHWLGQTVVEQLVSQWLAALGSFGMGLDLSILREFWIDTKYGFVIRSNALEASVRLARRECDRKETQIFFQIYRGELTERVQAYSLLNGDSPETDSLFWQTVRLLAARLAEESNVLAIVAAKDSAVRQRVGFEVEQAIKYLRQHHPHWLDAHQSVIEVLNTALSLKG